MFQWILPWNLPSSHRLRQCSIILHRTTSRRWLKIRAANHRENPLTTYEYYLYIPVTQYPDEAVSIFWWYFDIISLRECEKWPQLMRLSYGIRLTNLYPSHKILSNISKKRRTFSRFSLGSLKILDLGLTKNPIRILGIIKNLKRGRWCLIQILFYDNVRIINSSFGSIIQKIQKLFILSLRKNLLVFGLYTCY